MEKRVKIFQIILESPIIFCSPHKLGKRSTQSGRGVPKNKKVGVPYKPIGVPHQKALDCKLKNLNKKRIYFSFQAA